MSGWWKREEVSGESRAEVKVEAHSRADTVKEARAEVVSQLQKAIKVLVNEG